jgi:membrane protein YqaA with SNARE-associated domain
MGVFLFSLAINIIPFTGPSNVIIASVAAMNMPSANFIVIGLLVALGSSVAKLVHLYAAFFTRRVLSDSQRQRINGYTEKARRIGPLLLFLAAATPVPDDPVIIPLGLMKYNPLKFFTIFFIGKTTITIPGAYLGLYTRLSLIDLFDNLTLMGFSIALTVVATIILVKVDLGKYLARVTQGLKRRYKGR